MTIEAVKKEWLEWAVPHYKCTEQEAENILSRYKLKYGMMRGAGFYKVKHPVTGVLHPIYGYLEDDDNIYRAC